jgi:hypothetical protein
VALAAWFGSLVLTAQCTPFRVTEAGVSVGCYLEASTCSPFVADACGAQQCVARTDGGLTFQCGAAGSALLRGLCPSGVECEPGLVCVDGVCEEPCCPSAPSTCIVTRSRFGCATCRPADGGIGVYSCGCP